MYSELKDNEKIIVNEEKGTVTVKSTIRFNPTKHFRNNNDIVRYTNNMTFFGVARLKDTDTSNINFAKKIAENKMERQYHKHISKCIKEDISNIERILEYYTKELNKHTNKAERCNNRIVKLCSN